MGFVAHQMHLSDTYVGEPKSLVMAWKVAMFTTTKRLSWKMKQLWYLMCWFGDFGSNEGYIYYIYILIKLTYQI